MQRSSQQNRALHLYFKQVAEALNDAGYDMKKVLKEEVDIPWTTESVKNHLWRPIQKILLNKESTTEMNTFDPTEVYNCLSRHLAQKFDIRIEFPNEKVDRIKNGHTK